MPSITQKIVSNQIRFDLELIAKFIAPNSKVLDIGCADGELLSFLKQTKNVDSRGLEISHLQVSKALGRGLSVIQGDAENDLEFYPSQSFDYAILSQTIQATHNPKKILQEMLRIAKFAVISLPNFAHFRNRFHLLLKGTMPVNEVIPFSWFDTPNIHFCSIKDFENLCRNLGFKIEKEIFLTSHKQLPALVSQRFVANFFAEYGIFLISKNEQSLTNQEEFAFGKKLTEKLLPSGLKPAFSTFSQKNCG